MINNSKVKPSIDVFSDKDVNVFNDIHLNHINISVYPRTVEHAEKEILQFLNQNIHLKLKGNHKHIIQTFTDYLTAEGLPDGFLLNDFSHLLKLFEKITQATSFRVFFSIIETDMCRKFHTDANYLRLLCTYYGPGTLWLPDGVVNGSGEANKKNVKNSRLIQQANTGDVILLKGALYPNAKGVLHRSPSIEKTKEKRLLLRIDINESLNLI